MNQARHIHRSTTAQPLDLLEHGAVEIQLVRHPAVVAVTAAALGEIDAGHGQATEVGDDKTALDIEAGLAQRSLHPIGPGA